MGCINVIIAITRPLLPLAPSSIKVVSASGSGSLLFISQDKRGISAVQLSVQIGVTYKTAWSMLRRIRSAMGQRGKTHILTGVVEFDDAYFGGPTAGSKRGRGTEKAKVFVALSLDEHGNPK